MNSLVFSIIAIAVLLSGCGDAPIYRTELPNNYSYSSNGGSFGFFRNQNGNRYSEIFGIIDNGNERWCEKFAWERHLAICIEDNFISYVGLDTRTGEIHLLENEKIASKFWRDSLGSNIPTLRIKYPRTRKR